MGIERTHTGARILAANKALLDSLRKLVPLSESALIDSFLTHIRISLEAGDVTVLPQFLQVVHREHCEQVSAGVAQARQEHAPYKREVDGLNPSPSTNLYGGHREEARVGPGREPNPPQLSTGAEPKRALPKKRGAA